jgi:hypothetical protein
LQKMWVNHFLITRPIPKWSDSRWDPQRSIQVRCIPITHLPFPPVETKVDRGRSNRNGDLELPE